MNAASAWRYFEVFMLTLAAPWLIACVLVMALAFWRPRNGDAVVLNGLLGVAWCTASAALVNLFWMDFPYRVLFFGLLSFIGIGLARFIGALLHRPTKGH